MLNYFNFAPKGDSFLITNDLGRYMYISKKELNDLLHENIDVNSDFGKQLIDNCFYYTDSDLAFSDRAKYYIRDSKNYLFLSTSLHIFVVTNNCNLNCVYCQANSNNHATVGMMTKEIAKKSVDIALNSASKNLTFEFQGGEPLLNFEIIKYIVNYANENKKDKVIEFTIVSNLTLLTDEMIDFIKLNNIGISTSIDGNEILHNSNRSYKDKKGSFDDVIESIEKLKESGLYYGAIQTTTKQSLSCFKEIIDTYVDLELREIFIRPLTPLGCAANSFDKIGYTAEEFVNFYKDCLEYIIGLNKRGYYISEGHAKTLLTKIICGQPVNYMELRSPCGACIGQMAYYYDGNVFTCDEGRMLYEMGNDSFKLGNVKTDTVDDLLNSKVCKAVCASSYLESLPNCSDCVYNPYCGTCPVINLATCGDLCSKSPHDYKCIIYKGMLDTIFDCLNSESKEILESWVR